MNGDPQIADNQNQEHELQPQNLENQDRMSFSNNPSPENQFLNNVKIR